MKLLDVFKKQIADMGMLKRVWLTTFNLDISLLKRGYFLLCWVWTRPLVVWITKVCSVR